jgi:hypothetical protein
VPCIPRGAEYMDVSNLAQMMPKRFAGINILKGYKHCSSSPGRLRRHSRCKQIKLIKILPKIQWQNARKTLAHVAWIFPFIHSPIYPFIHRSSRENFSSSVSIRNFAPGPFAVNLVSQSVPDQHFQRNWKNPKIPNSYLRRNIGETYYIIWYFFLFGEAACRSTVPVFAFHSFKFIREKLRSPRTGPTVHSHCLSIYIR